MKRKTYNNFLKVANMIARKGYDKQTSFDLAHKCFENAEANPARMVEDFVDMILTKEEYDAMYN
jgi:hypothetical protein